jgi:pimeloyl-ACP methyl ester carboxylesterase
MPGYGFSDKPRAPGWGPDHIATAWIELMRRLGYDRFVAQGGDWGAIITDLMGVQAPPELAGIHSNMPGVLRPDISSALPVPGQLAPGGPAPSGHFAAWEQPQIFSAEVRAAFRSLR